MQLKGLIFLKQKIHFSFPKSRQHFVLGRNNGLGRIHLPVDTQLGAVEVDASFGLTYIRVVAFVHKHHLFAKGRKAMGKAPGFSALSEEVVFMYKCDNPYVREAERGINFNDPELGIDWKVDPTKAIVSPKDEVLPAFSEAEMNFLFQED